MTRPWYHEQAGPQLFNEWTWTHFAWGAVSARAVDWTTAVALHTLYELVEGALFPRAHRDVSAKNHVGDTLAFLAGRAALEGAPRFQTRGRKP